MIKELPRNEYPRPQFEREKWINLNGEWNFEFDDENLGLNDKWYKDGNFKKTIIVPYTFQCKLSNINIQEFHNIVWYSKSFVVPKEYENKKLILHFGAVDYKADIWVNGEHMATHEGGHISFSVDITRAIKKDEENIIVVRAKDYVFDLELPRGKQYWKEKSEFIFYTGTTGIWQTVWIEPLDKTSLEKVWITPDLDNKKVSIEYDVNGEYKDKILNVQILFNNKILVDDNIKIMNNKGKREFWLDQELIIEWKQMDLWIWTPENPVLFDIKFKILDNDIELDKVNSYFAFRKVSVEDGVFLLNNRPYYQKLLLDQGYWEESLLTAPTDEHFKNDIELCKKMGFNGVRKHQKIEDPRYFYWADKLGFLVWAEMANAYNYSKEYVKRINSEWIEIIGRDYNHPSIIVWVPLNESWGVEGLMNNKDEQAHAASMYWLTKSIDQTRPVISNDGWDHTKSDILTIHDYECKKEILENRYANIENILKARPSGRGMFAKSWFYEEQPVIVSEMGGISYKKSKWDGWGYSSATSDEDFINRYYNVITPLLNSPVVQGFCYTQITDVEQEINGLLTYAREAKVDLNIIKSINEGTYKIEK